MASNFPGPYQVELFYTVGANQHIARFNCDVDNLVTPGTPPGSINVITQGGGNETLTLCVAGIVALLSDAYPTTATFTGYDFYVYIPGTYDRTFITSGTLSVPGVNAGAPELAGYAMMTFKTYGGGTMRFTMIESSFVGNLKVSLSSVSSPELVAIRDFLLSSDNWIIAYDNSFPLKANNYLEGRNERLFKKYFR